MQPSERNLALEIAKGALAVIALPFSFLRRSTGSIGKRRQSARCASFDTSKWNPELLKHLEWRRFEELCAAYFEAIGFTPRITRSRADGGADIALHPDGAGAPTRLGQCRAWSAYPIGIKPLHELQAAMGLAGVGEAVFVTSGRFTKEAAEFAAKQKIELIDGAQLLEAIAALAPEKALALLKLASAGDFLTPTCPACSIKMTSRKSTGEGRAFWGCENYPSCKQTFSITVLAP